MAVTDEQLWWLLERSLKAARSQVGELWARGEGGWKVAWCAKHLSTVSDWPARAMKEGWFE